MSSLIISTNKATQSKVQADFNKLVKRINSRKKEIQELTNQLKTYNTKRKESLSTVLAERLQAQKKLVILLDEMYEKEKFTKKEKEKLEQLILNICNRFPESKTDEQLNKIVSKYLSIHANEIDEEELQQSAQMLQEMIEAEMGIKLDIDIANLKNMEEMQQKIQEKLAEQMHAFTKEQAANNKTKHAAGRTEKSKTEATALNQSWKTIYNKLVKALHPDVEQNEEAKKHKTAAMQEVTVAYEKSDFYTLLSLHLKYEHLTGANIAESDEATLKTYIKILKQQDKNLKDEQDDLRYMAVQAGPMTLSKQTMEIFIKMQKKEVEVYIQKINDDLKNWNDIKKLKQFLKEITMDDLLPVSQDFFEDAF